MKTNDFSSSSSSSSNVYSRLSDNLKVHYSHSVDCTVAVLKSIYIILALLVDISISVPVREQQMFLLQT